MVDPTRSLRLPGGGAVYSPSADHLIVVAQRELDRLAATLRRAEAELATSHNGVFDANPSADAKLALAREIGIAWSDSPFNGAHETAARILSAIRDGKVPGVRSCACDHTGPCKLHGQERDQLRAEVERMRADRDKCQRNEDEVGDRLEKAEAEVAENGRALQEIHDQVIQRCHSALEKVGIHAEPDGGGQPDYIIPSIVEASVNLLVDEVVRMKGVASDRLRHERDASERAEKAEAEVERLKLLIEDAHHHERNAIRFEAEANARAAIVGAKAERDKARHAEAVALLRECASILREVGGGVVWTRGTKAVIASIDAHLAACDGKGVGG